MRTRGCRARARASWWERRLGRVVREEDGSSSGGSTDRGCAGEDCAEVGRTPETTSATDASPLSRERVLASVSSVWVGMLMLSATAQKARLGRERMREDEAASGARCRIAETSTASLSAQLALEDARPVRKNDDAVRCGAGRAKHRCGPSLVGRLALLLDLLVVRRLVLEAGVPLVRHVVVGPRNGRRRRQARRRDAARRCRGGGDERGGSDGEVTLELALRRDDGARRLRWDARVSFGRVRRVRDGERERERTFACPTPISWPQACPACCAGLGGLEPCPSDANALPVLMPWFLHAPLADPRALMGADDAAEDDEAPAPAAPNDDDDGPPTGVHEPRTTRPSSPRTTGSTLTQKPVSEMTCLSADETDESLVSRSRTGRSNVMRTSSSVCRGVRELVAAQECSRQEEVREERGRTTQVRMNLSPRISVSISSS